MDTLVALGSGTAFVYSTIALFMMTDAQVRGDSAAAMSYMHEFYFESDRNDFGTHHSRKNA